MFKCISLSKGITQNPQKNINHQINMLSVFYHSESIEVTLLWGWMLNINQSINQPPTRASLQQWKSSLYKRRSPYWRRKYFRKFFFIQICFIPSSSSEEWDNQRFPNFQPIRRLGGHLERRTRSSSNTFLEEDHSKSITTDVRGQRLLLCAVGEMLSFERKLLLQTWSV